MPENNNDPSALLNIRRVAVVGSGAGTTARALVEKGLKNGSSYHVELIISTSVSAGINLVASEFAVTLVVLDRSLSSSEWSDRILEELRKHRIDIVALAGFMRLLPEAVIEAMNGHVLNIHPALLPKHGGLGMYGRKVHESVIQSGERQSGATVHLVNARYDEGFILGQGIIEVCDNETVDSLEKKVKAAEHVLYAEVLNSYSTDFSFNVGNW